MATKRTGLGRGIGSLIPAAPTATGDRPVDVFFPASPANPTDPLVDVPGAHLAYLSPDLIVPNAQQPRHDFDEADMAELVHSIREVGVLQPVVVRPIAGSKTYELIMGERRLRASKIVGLASIPAIVKETADDAMLRDALLENLHRSELNPLEEASAYQQLLQDFGITQEQLADRIGRSRPQISNTMRLLKLPEKIQTKVAAGVLSAGHARAILAAGDPASMTRLADRIIREDLSVRAAESIVATAKPVSTKPTTTAGTRRAHLNEVAERLGDRLDTRVKITLGAKKGLISVEFVSVADLNRILAELGEQPFGG
jgi:ParB family chromosome partitioning protein